ncbi:hypothetical protein [Morganella morganii]|uniref:hypothetical protein n=1 Tax=Morganella morganii TaxID=582 RepID=UPI0034D6BC19
MTGALKIYGVVAVVGAALGGVFGSLVTGVSMQSRIDDETRKRTDAEITLLSERNALADENARALKQIIRQQQEQAKQNAELSEKFRNTLSTLSTTTRRIERSIPAAVAADGDGWNGLGDSGLRLYREALGYSESGSDSVILSAPAAGTAVPAAPAAAAGVRRLPGAAETRGAVRGMGADTGKQAAGAAGMGSEAKAEQ